jgi:putative DNA methylase
MTPRKKLIEVALPLEAINAASAREKSIRHGHPSTLHLWWARRPLAACRAVLFSQLVDDPSSWPERFLTEEEQGAERKRLHDFIGGTKGADYKDGLVAWESSNNEAILNKARWYIARSLAWGRGEEPPDEDDPEAVRRYLLKHAPPVYDPFCGGGSIPLEAQRLGLRAFGSDLNPVAVMISKALVEFPPKFAGLPPVNPESRKKLANGGAWNAKGAQGLAEDVRYYGRWMRNEAKKRIGSSYPEVDLPDGSKATVIAWLWARTVASPNPACRGARVPLVRSFELSTKPGKKVWVEPVVDAANNSYQFQIRSGPVSKTPAGTVGRQGGRCLISGTPMPLNHIRSEGKAGRMGQRLMAVVAEGKRGRVYLPPNEEHERVAKGTESTWVPEGDLPRNPRDFKTPGYGMMTWASLFTPRQLVALTTFSDLVLKARANALEDAKAASLDPDPTFLADGGTGAQAYADVLAVYLALSVSRQANRSSTICFWDTIGQKVQQVFARQAIPMTWDFTEANPFSNSSGNFGGQVEYLAKVIEASPCTGCSVKVWQANAAEKWLRDGGLLISTDPPYYDNIGYADLSDFFYIWLRPMLYNLFRSDFKTMLVPKAKELVATPYRFDGGRDEAEAFFLTGMSKAINRMASGSSAEYPVAFYYAFKQSEKQVEGVASTGWATFLEAVVAAGFQVDGTWPVRTELTGNLKKLFNALASSIVLVCRKGPADAPSVTRGEFLRVLRAELPAALRTLQESAIAPVDMAQASIGPGMAVFSRYKEVLEADDTRMSVREALRIINAELDAYLGEQEGDYDSWTRFAVTWFQQHGFDSGRYGEAETLAKARDVAVQGVVEAGILEAKGGKARLLRREELPADYLPFRDNRQTVWEGCQHLIKRLQDGSEEPAARLAKQLGYQADMARDLTYRLYQICERNKWAEEARAYNGLIESWREIIKIRDTLPDETTPGPRQPELAL